MYDYGLSVLEQYGLTAFTSGRVRGALLCQTEKGPVILREFHGSEKKLSMQQQLLEKLKRIVSWMLISEIRRVFW